MWGMAYLRPEERWYCGMLGSGMTVGKARRLTPSHAFYLLPFPKPPPRSFSVLDWWGLQG